MSSSNHQTQPEPHVPCHHNEKEGRSSLPPADWVNQVTATDIGAQQSRFEFFYHVIFTFVHSALTLLMTPVLKNTRPRRRRRGGQHQLQRSRVANIRTHPLQQREPQSFGEVDPELAMPSRTVVDNRIMGGSSSSSSILKSQRRRSGDQLPACAGGNTATTAAKSVRFPEPRRSRPPLGRISSSTIGASSSSSSAASVGEASNSSSVSSSSRNNGRGRMAQRYTPRTHHTTYFLSD